MILAGCVVCVLLLQPCSTFCNPMDCSLPVSSVHGILQTRILEWVAFSPPGELPDTGRSNPRLLCLLHWQVVSLPLGPPGKPLVGWHGTKHTRLECSVLTEFRKEGHGKHHLFYLLLSSLKL